MGFELNYNRKHLGKSKYVSEDESAMIGVSKHNNDDIPLFVRCQSCEEYMDFKEGSQDMFNSWWICPLCKSKVRESTVYNKLEKENTDWLNENIPQDEEPECCKACGGPYPDCITSCKIFDD